MDYNFVELGIQPIDIPHQDTLRHHGKNRCATRPTERRKLDLGLSFLSDNTLLDWDGFMESEHVPDHLHLLLGKAFLEEPKIVIKIGRLNMRSPNDARLAHENVLHGNNCRGPIALFGCNSATETW
jgi:hypothetical protein